MIDQAINLEIDPDLQYRADLLFHEQQQRTYESTDKLFAGLLVLEWLASILLALVVAPLSWEASRSHLNPHLIYAVLGGGALTLLPCALVTISPGKPSTRHIIAISQMLFSALLIHLSNGRIETHFHIFGSLALLAFYRDWRVLLSASAIVTIDHLVRGIFLPQSVYGIALVSPMRTVEHAAWVVFEDIFLIRGIAQSVAEMKNMAAQRARLEESNLIIERKVDEKTAELRNRERESRRLATLVEQSEDAIVSMDLKGRIQSWNRGAERLCHYRSDEILGLNYDPPLPAALKKQHLEFLEKAKDGQAIESVETLLYRKGGSLVDVSITLSPIRDNEENITSLCFIIRDITQKKIVEKRISEFYSVMSHELRTPLTSIRGALALIAEGVIEQASDEATELIDIAQKSTLRLIRLINDILDLRKIEAGKFEMSFEEIQADEVVETSMQSMAGFAEENKVQLQLVAEENCFILGDEFRLVQVLSNLISNAIKYAPESSTVTVKSIRHGSSVRFSVTDTGHGIPEDQQHKLFGKFQQIDASDTRAKEGSGLGLAISKAIVEEHKSELNFHSMPNVETVFYFDIALSHQHSDANSVGQVRSKTLPINENKLKEIKSKENKLNPLAAEIVEKTLTFTGCKRVLIVEDDIELSSMLRIDLEQQNYVCSLAQTLHQAKEILRSDLPDAMILDLELPDGNGLELLETLQREKLDSETSAALPVIVITGTDRQLVDSNFIIDWLHKPFSHHCLTDAITKALATAPARKPVMIVDNVFVPKATVSSELKQLIWIW